MANIQFADDPAAKECWDKSTPALDFGSYAHLDSGGGAGSASQPITNAPIVMGIVYDVKNYNAVEYAIYYRGSTLAANGPVADIHTVAFTFVSHTYSSEPNGQPNSPGNHTFSLAINPIEIEVISDSLGLVTNPSLTGNAAPNHLLLDLAGLPPGDFTYGFRVRVPAVGDALQIGAQITAGFHTNPQGLMPLIRGSLIRKVRSLRPATVLLGP